MFIIIQMLLILRSAVYCRQNMVYEKMTVWGIQYNGNDIVCIIAEPDRRQRLGTYVFVNTEYTDTTQTLDTVNFIPQVSSAIQTMKACTFRT